MKPKTMGRDRADVSGAQISPQCPALYPWRICRLGLDCVAAQNKFREKLGVTVLWKLIYSIFSNSGQRTAQRGCRHATRVLWHLRRAITEKIHRAVLNVLLHGSDIEPRFYLLSKTLTWSRLKSTTEPRTPVWYRESPMDASPSNCILLASQS